MCLPAMTLWSSLSPDNLFIIKITKMKTSITRIPTIPSNYSQSASESNQ
jgi:hypothetical protein